jgi:iron complex outermembrane receptor protein
LSFHAHRERLLATTFICGAAFFALSATQAVAAEAAAAGTEVTEVVVTGSRIPQPNLTSVSPVQVVTGEEFKVEGKTDVIDLINNLPQNFQNAQADFSGTSNPLVSAGGISTADLRGLGPQRTLVLVDGRRLGIGDASTLNTTPAPDLNQIPAALVSRVEVLTGGASATYGSDAVAGVVNFVMKHNFQGIQVDGQFGINQHSQQDPQGIQALERAKGYTIPKKSVWDGRGKDLSLMMGTNGFDDKANITVYLTYHHQDPVSQSSRDYSACQLRVSKSVPRCSGSVNSNQFFEVEGSGPGVNNNNGYTVIGNQFVDYASAPNTGTPGLLFNSSPYQYLEHGDTRYSAGLFSHYELTRNLDVYADFSFMNDRTRTSVAPSGLFEGSGPSANAGFLVNCNNPLLSAQQAATLCSAADIARGANVDLIIGRRNIEGGPRSSTYEHQNYRAVVGARGEVPDFEGWKYDIYGSYYYTSLFQGNYNYLSNGHIQNALQVVSVNGKPTCISGGACVPFNIFSQGGVTQSQIDYVNSYGTSYGTVSESIVEANLTGDLTHYGLKSPWADAGIGVSAGIQDRRQKYDYKPDQNELSNDLSGFGGAGTAISATVGVTEAYGEIRVPIAQNMPFVDDLVFDGGYRYSHYSTDVNAETFKLGLQWAPVSDIRFRGSFNRAIRAPSIVDLFIPASVTNSQQLAVDPCAPNNGAPATATLTQCMHTGVTAAQYGNGGSTNHIIQCPAGQCAVLLSGNVKLSPEQANTYSVGFTLTPRMLPGFTGSVDYYKIKLEKGISSPPQTFVLDQCLNTGDPTYCSKVVRAPSGILFGTAVAGGGYIDAANANLGAAETSGIDFQAAYNLALNTLGLGERSGDLQFSFIGSELIKQTTTPAPGLHVYDCAGLFGPTCQTVSPKWRHTLRASWKSPWDLMLSAQWRYIGSTSYEANTSDETLSNGRQDNYDAKLKAVSYFDLTGVWKVTSDFTVRAGVNNVFDKDPQILDSAIVSAGLPNTYPTYDLLGRTMFVSFTANF